MENMLTSVSTYKRLKTREVKIGHLLMGNNHPIRLQTMTTPDTMDTEATVLQTIKCVEAGAELVRITAPSKKEAENLANIKSELKRRGYDIPLVADIHFTPNAAEIAARIVEKVRINPGNYIDKKKFEVITYTDESYQEEIDRIQKRFTPLLKICKEYGTAMRIGTNHGSLSDRIMSRYGDTPMGMVESAMEFLRIARYENYHNIVLSMKSSNPQVMVQAYRLLVQVMLEEFGECYPLHLGVTEAGDGEDGRVKSAVGMGTLLEDGIGDTVRVSLTEEPEFEIPVCRDLIKRYPQQQSAISSWDQKDLNTLLSKLKPSYQRRQTFEISNIGGSQVPVVISDLSKMNNISVESLQNIGYKYNETLDKWAIGDIAADYVFTNQPELDFSLPGMLKVITSYEYWKSAKDKTKYFPLFSMEDYLLEAERSSINFVFLNTSNKGETVLLEFLNKIKHDKTVVLLVSSPEKMAMAEVRKLFWFLEREKIQNPAILFINSEGYDADEHLIHFASEVGALLIEGFGDGICLTMERLAYDHLEADFNKAQTLEGRNYYNNETIEAFLNGTAFSILQASRTRISKTEYISCPSCGRTLFDLQETTAKIRSRTNHLKGVKIAIMGCIVNGPGEMADADFGYVGSGIGKITLYRNKEVVKRGIDSEIAVEELINLLKESGAWIEPKESEITQNA